MSAGRIGSFAAFWPFYISQHRDPRSRALHFVGTNGFIAATIACVIDRPATMVPVVLGIAVAVWAAFRMEARRNAAPVLIGVVVAAALAHPAMLGAVVFAYAFAWVGHFRVEHNRPATFTYPLWSLAGDFRMCGLMWTGQLWSGRGETIAPLEGG